MDEVEQTPKWVERLTAEYLEQRAKLDKLEKKLPGLRKEISTFHFNLLRMQRDAMRKVLTVISDRLRDAGVRAEELATEVDDAKLELVPEPDPTDPPAAA